MRIYILTLFIFFAFRPCAGLSETQDKTSTPFSVSVNLVKVPISIFNEKGQMITDLRKEDVRVWEDQSLQQIRSFGVDSMPVSVVMLLDTSKSGKRERNKIRDAAIEFTRSLSPGDQVSLITFDDQVRLLLDWTQDMNKVRKKLGQLQSGLRTALYDAMYLAADEQLKNMEGRKVIILLTDCLNNQSLVGFQEASLKIVQSQASLYVVSKTSMVRKDAKKEHRVIMLNNIYKKLFGQDENYIDEFFNRMETEMADLADKTGGRCFFPEDYDQIKDNYSDIAMEMKTKYFLTYVSNQDLPPDSFHEISIEYLKPFSKINYRKGYYYLPVKLHQTGILRPSFN